MYELLVLVVLMFLSLYTVFVHTYTKHSHTYMYISRHLDTRVRMYGVYTSQNCIIVCLLVNCLHLSPVHQQLPLGGSQHAEGCLLDEGPQPCIVWGYSLLCSPERSCSEIKRH